MSKISTIFSKTRLIISILSTFTLGLLSACNAGNNMKAELFFQPDMVTLLHTIQQGDALSAQQQLSNGLDLNVHGNEGITPLFWLLLEKDTEAVALALNLGANPNFTATDGAHPVPMMTGNDTIELLTLLLEHGGDANAIDRDGQPAIFGAIGMGDWNEIELLIKHGVDLDETNKAKENSALYAADINRFQEAYAFVQLGASYHTPSKSGVTLAFSIYESLEDSPLKPGSDSYNSALKVKDLLIEKGINFPPLSPAEVRERIAKGQPIN